MRREQPEAAIQAAIVVALRFVIGRYYIVAAVPNGGKRSRIEAAIMQGTGTIAGAADLVITGHGFSGWMEVKHAGPKLSKAQIEFRAECERRRIPYTIVRSVDDALAACVRWGLAARAEDGALRPVPPAGVGGVAAADRPPGRRDAGEGEALRGVPDEGGIAAGVNEEVARG